MNLYSNILLNFYYIVPFLITILLTIISITPIMPPGYESLTPLLGIISMSFWVIHRPDLMGWFFVLIIGLISDIIYGTILGSACLSSILIRLVLSRMFLKLDFKNVLYSLYYISVSLFIYIFTTSFVNMPNISQLNYLIEPFFQYITSIIMSPIVILLQLYLLKIITR
jgi:rod shape-determining protein MreD